MTIDDILAIINQTLNYSEFTFYEDENSFVFGTPFGNPGPLGHITSNPMKNLNIVDILANFGKVLQSAIVHEAANDLTRAQAREMLGCVTRVRPRQNRAQMWLPPRRHPRLLKGLESQGLVFPENIGRGSIAYGLTAWGRLIALELWNRQHAKEHAA